MRLNKGVSVLAGLVLLVPVLVLIVPRFGYENTIVVSGSMEPHIPAGSLVITKRLLPNQYKVGDVVTFIRPTRERTLVTHRLSALHVREDSVYAETKGDANINGDPWTISLGAIVGKEKFHIPWLGYGIHFSRTLSGFIVLAGLLFVLAVVPELQFMGKFFRTAGKT